MKTLVYRIELLEPTLVTALEGDPNSAVAFDYLPGSVLRGVLIERFIRQQRRGDPDFELDAAEGDTRRVFFEPTTRYLNGYLVERNTRSLPIPLSFQSPKRQKFPVRDLVYGAEDTNILWKGQSGFGVINSDTFTYAAPRRQITVHTQRDRVYGRPLGGANGTVYQYEALAAGQTFEAAILCDEDGDADWLKALLDQQEGWIGGARTAGYGRVRFEVQHFSEESWREVNTQYPTQGPLTLTLLSDAILRDANGCYAADLISARTAIAQRLGVQPESLGKGSAYLATTQVGGFNRKWGLPLPQTSALAMGSVLTFEHPGCPTDRLEALEQAGIGERRTEGFGRIAINVSSHNNYTEYIAPEAEDETPVTLTELPAVFTERLIAQAMERVIVGRAHTLKVQKPPRPSQINFIRLELAEDGREIEVRVAALREALKSIEARQVARTQFQKARVNKQTLSQWLESMIQAIEAEDWYKRLGITQPKFAPNQPLPEFCAIYTLRLIDAVLARAAKDSKGAD